MLNYSIIKLIIIVFFLNKNILMHFINLSMKYVRVYKCVSYDYSKVNENNGIIF